MTESELIALAIARGGSVGPTLSEAMASCRLNGETQVVEPMQVVAPADRMNKTERAYSEALEERKRRGDIKAWYFEAVKLRLAQKTFYTPDFMVVTDSGVEFHETKGFMRDDAAVKLKVAAHMYPAFTFRLVKREKGVGWYLTEIPKL